jgi:hypothetical protein
VEKEEGERIAIVLCGSLRKTKQSSASFHEIWSPVEEQKLKTSENEIRK